MIYIHRKEAPRSFSEIVLRCNQLEEMRHWLISPPEERASPPSLRPLFSAEYPKVVEHVGNEFNNKCAFCECWLTDNNRRIALFRPLRNSLQKKGGVPDPVHYFWLLWDWSNLYAICRDCRDNQGSLFPTENERVTPDASHLERENAAHYFVQEKPVLIDPTQEAPAKHIVFGENGEIKPRGGSGRGETTIQIFELNRAPLRQARAEEARRLKDLWRQARDLTIQNNGIVDSHAKESIDQLLAECENQKPFAGMKRQLLLDWINHATSSIDTPAELKSALGKPPWRNVIDQLEEWLYPPIEPRKIPPPPDPPLLREGAIVFLCHASEDKPLVQGLYQRLKEAGYHPWLDKENLLPGQDWREEIEKILKDLNNLVLVCLSCRSVTKRGVVQQEIKWALDMLDRMPEGAIFLIPARLEKCDVPDRLSHLHWVDLFEDDGFDKLTQALDFELRQRQQ